MAGLVAMVVTAPLAALARGPRGGVGARRGGCPRGVVCWREGLAHLWAAVLLASALVVAVNGSTAAATPAFPQLSGRVVDAAGLLDSAILAKLEGELAAQEGKTSDQLVVATVPSLGGLTIEDYANQLFRAWKLGQAKTNNGVLLLVAPTERKVRIEVGYGLEGILTDAVASAIIRNRIVPAFKAGDMPGGVLAGVQAILELLNLDPEEARARARALDDSPSEADWVGLLLLLLMVGVWIYLFWRAAHSAGRGARMAGPRRRSEAAKGPITTWDWGNGGGGGGGGWSGGGGSSGGGGASGGW